MTVFSARGSEWKSAGTWCEEHYDGKPQMKAQFYAAYMQVEIKLFYVNECTNSEFHCRVATTFTSALTIPRRQRIPKRGSGLHKKKSGGKRSFKRTGNSLRR